MDLAKQMIDDLKRIIVCILIILPHISVGQLSAEFSADTTRGCGALGVQFTDQSTGNITSRTWSFGNSNTSNLTNPFENYGVGSFTVSLTVSDGTNSDTETKTAFINVYTNPTADFTFNPSTGCTPLPVAFNSTSTIGSAPIVSYIWDVKDGSSSPNASSFTHTYQAGGPFVPTLQIIDGNGCSDNKTASSGITPTASPVADFSTQASPIGCSAPFTVDFINNSSGSNLTYQWGFGDGASSTQMNPTHTYTRLGNFTVSLTVSDPNCSSTESKNSFVQINTTVADFTTAADTFCFGEGVRFTNNSVGANNFSWDFDDGSPRSFTRDPLHTFLDSGWFDITLVASIGSACVDQVIKSIYIQKIEADFDIVPEFTCQLPDTVRFFDKSYGAFRYQWGIQGVTDQFLDTAYEYTVKNPVHLVRDTGIRYDQLIIYSEFGCSDTMLKNVRFADTLVPNIIINGPLGAVDEYGGCFPFTLSYTDSVRGPGNIVSYFWNFGDGTTFNGKTPPPKSYTTQGTYYITLRVTNDSGCVATDSTRVIAVPPDDATFFVYPDTVCQGDTVWIEMSTSRGNFYSFNIATNKYVDQKSTDSSYRMYFDDFLDTGYFAVTVSAGDICITSHFIDSAFYVLGPVLDPSYRYDCTNPTTAYITGNILGATRFYWDFGDGSPLDSNNKDPNHVFPKDTIYEVILTAYNDTNRCSVQKDTLEVDLRPIPPPNRLPYKKYHCRDNQKVRLFINNLYFYQTMEWYLNDSLLGDFEEDYFDKSIFPNGRSKITLIGTDASSCPDTINDFIFISDPRPRFTSTVQGACIPFNVQMIDTSLVDTTILSWEWFFSNKPNDTFKIQNPIVNINTLGKIGVRLRITDFLGCVGDTLIDDLVSGGSLSADFTTGSNTNICVGDSIQYFNRSSGTNVTSIWNFNDGTIDTIASTAFYHRYDSAGNFPVTLVALDNNGCRDTLNRYLINVEAKPTANFIADTTIATCYPFAVNFSDISSGNITYRQWDLGGGDSITLTNPFRNYLSPGNYDVQLIVETANGCRDTLRREDYIQITGPTATFNISADSICLNEPITFTLITQNGVGSFRWAFGDGNTSTANPATHIYTDTAGLIQPSLIIRDVQGGCEVIIKDSVMIREVIAKYSLDDTSGCEPFSPVITNLMQGEDNFIWDLGDGRTSTDRTPQFTYDQKGSYDLKLSVSSNIGCTDESTITVDVFETPIAAINGNSSICLGDSTLLSGSGGTEYQWYTNSTLISMSQSIKVSPDSIQLYQLVVGNQFDCYDTTEVEVNVQLSPTYSPIPDSIIIIGEKIILNASSGPGFTFSWTPTTGLSCSDCPNPTAQPLSTTTYILEIKDASGCFSIKDTITITVKEEFTLDVPQAFSPNGDGVNDIIYAEGWGLKELIAFKIYNRFGELIFESNDFEVGWDGTYNGKDQMLETYVYTVEAETYKGEILQKKGNITLLR